MKKPDRSLIQYAVGMGMLLAGVWLLLGLKVLAIALMALGFALALTARERKVP